MARDSVPVNRTRRGTVDVSRRRETARRAVAEGFLVADPETIEALRQNRLEKFDPLPSARAAALLAAKRTPDLIPHCHPLRLTAVGVDFEFTAESVRVICEVSARDRTGPPMEALHGVTTALLTLYDMVKGRCPDARLTNIRLLQKAGGRSGQWRAEGFDE